ncbi:MAG: LacI family DNA-binding transcriptional regulator [Lachnospiraceae bacterium]|nr:LacI family DNA-binding transcriptional regulator [Lachnospiraceae bacterium]MDY4970964.1 LacI family DNA-binding transcriptional regulator [Lachnospiraceae bacterium]
MGQIKKVKMEDIARALGVSVVTVSNALKGRKGVGDDLRGEIIRKAEEMGYHVKNSSSSEKTYTRNCYHVGIIIAERYVKEYPSFYMEIYKQVAQAALKQECLTALEVVVTEAEQKLHASTLFQSMEIDGLLIIGEMQADYIRKLYKDVTVPIVCVDFYDMNLDMDMDYIITDGYHGMELVTQELIRAGHRDIGFVGTPRATNSIMDRYMGYCKALQLNGIAERADRVYDDREESGYTSITGVNLPEDLPTAFVCNCDRTAAVLIRKLEERGIRVPEDVSVGGFDHYCDKLPENMELLTYESDMKAMAQISVNTLLKRIEGKKKPEGVRTVQGRVIKGNTVRKLNG